MTITLRCSDLDIEMFVVLLDSDGDTTQKKEPDGRLWQCARFEFAGVKERLYAGRWFTGQIDEWPEVIDMPGQTTKRLREILNSHQVPEEIQGIVDCWAEGCLSAWA